MDIVVKGRNVEVPEHFRVHVAEKLNRSERYDPKIIRVDVELSHETNRRQSKTCQRVQITLASRGPAVRAEASADSFYAALDSAVTKLEARLRRSADRRHDHQHSRTPIAAVAATPEEILGGGAPLVTAAAGSASTNGAATSTAVLEGQEVDGAWLNGSTNGAADRDSRGHLGRRRRRTGAGRPDQGPPRRSDHRRPGAVPDGTGRPRLLPVLSTSTSRLPSVVYRRKGFDYGLLRLT